jgi:transcriptional regulator with XRE-family HTH domain
MPDTNVYFSEFIRQEISKRSMSARAFAAFIGVTHSTINRFSDPTESGLPSLEFLRRLSIKTQVDICTIIGLIFPELVPSTNIETSAIILAEQIEHLPSNIRQVVESIVRDNLANNASSS